MPFDDRRMTFTGHLAELRQRIIYSAVAVLVSFFVCFIFAKDILVLLQQPLTPISEAAWLASLSGGEEGGTDNAGDVPAEPSKAPQWTTLNPLEGFVVYFKIAGYGSLVFAFPWVLYQICAFVFPGLEPKERRAVQMMIFGGVFLAMAGVAIAYWIVFPFLLQYLMQYTPDTVLQQFRLNETISIVIKGLVGFALAFQFPLAVVLLVYMGILDPVTLRQYRKFAFIGLAVASAIFTPPDPVSMLILLAPMYALYEVSIWVSIFIVRKRNNAETFPSGDA